MESNNIDNSFKNNSSKFSQKSNISSMNNNSFSENIKLFEATVEIAVNYNLILPSKNYDFILLEKKMIFDQNRINNENSIDLNKLNEIMKILSKYDN